jgi:predicted nuclease of restriction endonuclease-like (RecB) superfamily
MHTLDASEKQLLLFNQIRYLLESARTIAASQVNSLVVCTNFLIGKYIVEHESRGSIRADYAEKMICSLSARLTKEFGPGYSERNLWLFKKFYQMYTGTIKVQTASALLMDTDKNRNDRQILQTVSAEFKAKMPLSWSHYVFLMGINDDDERAFYTIESTKEFWSLRELRRQFNSSLYERIALSRNKKKVKELSKKGLILTKPQDSLKDPYILEFLGLEEQSSYTETELETAIINKLGHFLLEMGKGFLFQARQKRITLEDRHYYIDLVLYNRHLQCFVLIDLKIGEILHQDIGQMQMYVNYYDRYLKAEPEGKTIGIILCKKQNKALVEITLPETNNQIFTRNYQHYFPSKTQLQKQLQKFITDAES